MVWRRALADAAEADLVTCLRGTLIAAVLTALAAAGFFPADRVALPINIAGFAGPDFLELRGAVLEMILMLLCALLGIERAFFGNGDFAVAPPADGTDRPSLASMGRVFSGSATVGLPLSLGLPF